MDREERRVALTEPIGIGVSLTIWAFCLYLQNSLPFWPMQLAPGWRWSVGVLFLADGLGTFIWSTVTLAKARREGSLARSGPYAVVRHPMYGAMLWNGTAAVAFLFQSWIVLLTVVPLHLGWIWLVQPEEKQLLQRFGEDYRRYIQETGQFMPRLASLKQAAKDFDNLKE